MRIISMKGTGFELTAAIQEYVEKKLPHLEKLTVNDEPRAELRVEVAKTTNHHNKGDIFRAEFTLSVPGASLRAEEDAEDLYAAVDLAVDDLRRQLLDRKEKGMEDRKEARPDKMA